MIYNVKLNLTNMKKTAHLNKYVLVLFGLFLTLSCEYEQITETAPASKNNSFEEFQRQTSNQQLYDNLLLVLRDIEVSDLNISYDAFELEMRHPERKAEFEKELKEALEGINSTDVNSINNNQMKAGNCKSNVNSKKLKAATAIWGEIRSIIRWSNTARKKYGWKYRKWSKAKNKHTFESLMNPGFFHHYECWAKGTPCK